MGRRAVAHYALQGEVDLDIVLLRFAPVMPEIIHNNGSMGGFVIQPGHISERHSAVMPAKAVDVIAAVECGLRNLGGAARSCQPAKSQNRRPYYCPHICAPSAFLNSACLVGRARPSITGTALPVDGGWTAH